MSMGSVAWSSNRFSVGPDGYRWQSPGQDRQGPWSDIVSVMTFRASASYGGFQVGAWQHLGVTFADGSAFKFHSQSQEAYQVADLTVGYAAPLIVRRLAAQLETGQPLNFGEITLTQERLSFRSKSWALSQIVGHRTYQGSWMMDVGPRSSPSLVVQLMLTKLPNFFAFRAMLEALIPGRDYGDAARDLGSMWRPSASSHDPRYISGRTRLQIIGGFLGVAAVGGLAVLSYLNMPTENDKRIEAMRREEAALVEIAQGTAVAAGTPYLCDVDTPSDAIMYKVRAPEGMTHPGYGYGNESEIFDYSPSGTPMWTHGRPWLLFVEQRALSDKVGTRRTVTFALRLVESETRQVRCQGEVIVGFDDVEEYDLNHRLEDSLQRISCGARQDERCAALREKVEIVFPAPTPAEVAPEARAEVEAPARKGRKKGRRAK